MTAAEPDLKQDVNAPARAPSRERVKLSQDIAAGIAHELRNPVFGIASAAQLFATALRTIPSSRRISAAYCAKPNG